MVHADEVRAFKHKYTLELLMGFVIIGTALSAVLVFLMIVIGLDPIGMAIVYVLALCFVGPAANRVSKTYWIAQVKEGAQIVEEVKIAIPRIGGGRDERGVAASQYKPGRSHSVGTWYMAIYEMIFGFINYSFHLLGMMTGTLLDIIALRRAREENLASALHEMMIRETGLPLSELRQMIGRQPVAPIIRGLRGVPGVMIIEIHGVAMITVNDGFRKDFTALRSGMVAG